MINLRHSFALILTTTMLSCSNMLDINPTSVITGSSYWDTEEDAVGGLYGMYARFRGQASHNLFYWGEARSELLSYGVQGAGNRQRYFENSLDANFAGPNWQGMYTVVHDANLLIKYVPTIEGMTDQLKNDILAQAYCMRAFIYFTMAKTWGNLPIVTEPTAGYDPDVIFKERADVHDVFSFIKSDIEQSLALFDSNEFPDGRYLWSRPAANALKADIYLWTGKVMETGQPDLEVAYNAVTDVEEADVALLDDFSSVFNYSNKGNREIIFSVRFEDLESGFNVFEEMYFAGGYSRASEDVRNTLGVPGGSNWWAPSALIRGQFTDVDYRKRSTFVEVFIGNDQRDTTYYGTAVLKGQGTIVNGQRRFVEDIIIYRFSDILLMKAEILNALGRDPEESINRVRRRAYRENFENYRFITGNKEQNDEAILQERLFELAFEGKRWWDLIRFDKAFDKVPSLQNRADDRYLLLFPISEATLSLEPKIQQNPGYER